MALVHMVFRSRDVRVVLMPSGRDQIGHARAQVVAQ